MNKDELRVQKEKEEINEVAEIKAEKAKTWDNNWHRIHVSKHSKSKQKAKNWFLKAKRARKIAKLSRRKNRGK